MNDTQTTGTEMAMEKAAPQPQSNLAIFDGNEQFKKLSLREIQQLGDVFKESGFFPDIKHAAQAVVKIIAGQELGFPPVVAMTGIHFFQNKVEFSSTLKASAIKASGRYDYKILKHTNQECEVAFFKKVNNEWVSCGVPVTYTMRDAQAAGLSGKDNWKKFGPDMLFAACIRQGFRRYCADVLRGYVPETDSNEGDAVDAQAFEDAAAQNQTVDSPAYETMPTGEQVDTSTGEVIEAELVHEDPDAKAEREAIAAEEPLAAGSDDSNLINLRNAALDAFNATKGEARTRANSWIGDKTFGVMNAAELKAFIEAVPNF